MHVQAIIPAAGRGERLKSAVPKAFVPLGDRPLVARALAVMEESPSVKGVVLVIDERCRQDAEAMIGRFNLSKITRMVAGGPTRAASVQNGMAALDSAADTVLIHDAARPLVVLDLVERAIALCAQRGAVITAVPVKPTIKQVNRETMTVTATPDRSTLWEAQTPQVFSRALLETAWQAVGDENFTDEAGLIECYGREVAVLAGDGRNLKVTTHEDLMIAAALLEAGAKSGKAAA